MDNALLMGMMVVHGALGDTTNQIAKPRLGRRTLPAWLTPLFMATLVAAEIGGFCVLWFGFIRAAFFSTVT